MGTAVLNEVNIRATHLDKYKRLIDSTQHWHKFIINNSASIDRNTLLDSVLRTVFPNDLIPLQFRNEYFDSHFLAKNCRGAIEELYNKGLAIPNPVYGGMLNVTIILGFKKLSDLNINYHENIKTVIHKRYNKDDGSLNLSRFHEDPDLTEYFPLCQPRILEGVFTICKGFDIKVLNLSENKLNQLGPVWKQIRLKKIDLSKNMINAIDELQVLGKFDSIEEIILEGNPFCEYYDEYSYAQAILAVLPSIKKVDFVEVRRNLLPSKKNYLCCPEGHEFTDQFLDHFFTLYDKQRSSLRDIYHCGATFTISCHYNKDKENYAKADLEYYTTFARNLKTLSDITNSYDNMFMGCDNIMAVLCQLPPTTHDPCSFMVDLVLFSYNFAMVIVTGIFQESGGQILGFNRTFMLTSADGLQYFIINDKLHINQATLKQFRSAFEEVSVSDVNTMSEITSMNMKWSKKCLKDFNGDLRAALIAFQDLYQMDEIPTEAFNRSLFSSEPIKFNFKNMEYTMKSPGVCLKEIPNNSMNLFEAEDCENRNIIHNKDHTICYEEDPITLLNTQNKTVPDEVDMNKFKKQCDTFKLSRKSMDLKMKQINDTKKFEYIRSHIESLIEKETNLSDKCLTQRAKLQEDNEFVRNFKMNVVPMINQRSNIMNHSKISTSKKGMNNPNVRVIDLTNDTVTTDGEVMLSKSHFTTNVMSRADFTSLVIPNLFINNQNSLPQAAHPILTNPLMDDNKPVFVKKRINNKNLIKIKKKNQMKKEYTHKASKQCIQKVQPLSTFAKMAYRKKEVVELKNIQNENQGTNAGHSSISTKIPYYGANPRSNNFMVITQSENNVNLNEVNEEVSASPTSFSFKGNTNKSPQNSVKTKIMTDRQRERRRRSSKRRRFLMRQAKRLNLLQQSSCNPGPNKASSNDISA